MKHAAIGPIAVHFPARIETNEHLQQEFPAWDMKLIGSKTGIMARHIAEPDECSSDLGVAAYENLFREQDVDPQTIDYLIICTQTPDYALPTTACLVQERLGLRTNIGALDFNLGCSGYIYGLSLADGLIKSGVAKRILFITAETYSKFIDAADRSLRTIFGDAATATIIEAADQPTLSGFQFGTDGSGADTLFATGSGFRSDDDAIQPRHRKRWKSQLYMDGPSLISFTVGKIPGLVDGICEAAGISKSDVGQYLFHQATFKMLEQLREALEIEAEALPIKIENIGNTVSCTLPILIDQMRAENALTPEVPNLLVGFGVGWSWGGCVWYDRFKK